MTGPFPAVPPSKDAFYVTLSTSFKHGVVRVCAMPAPRWRQWINHQLWLPWWLWQFGASRCGRPAAYVGRVSGAYFCEEHGRGLLGVKAL